MVVKRIGPMSLAKIGLVMYGFFGLIGGVVLAAASMIMSSAAGTDGNSLSMLGPVFGVGAIIILPICYGIFGFIGGLISAAIYNLLAGMVGGVEIDVA
jgi:hypothetical protein